MPLWNWSATTPSTHWYKRRKQTRMATSSSWDLKPSPPTLFTSVRSPWYPHPCLHATTLLTSIMASRVPSWSPASSHVSLLPIYLLHFLTKSSMLVPSPLNRPPKLRAPVVEEEDFKYFYYYSSILFVSKINVCLASISIV